VLKARTSSGLRQLDVGDGAGEMAHVAAPERTVRSAEQARRFSLRQQQELQRAEAAAGEDDPLGRHRARLAARCARARRRRARHR
jgi:hypothetical protein